MSLPELPEPDSHCTHKDDHEYDVWNAEQMQAFAEEAIQQERARCLTICAELHEHYSGYKDTALLNGDVELSNAASGEPRACEAIAAAIRAGSKRAPRFSSGVGITE